MGRKRKVFSIHISEEVKRLYNSKTGLKQIDIVVFQKWYDSKNGCCDYCGLTSEESLILFNRYPQSTRGGRRGKRLELDRINPAIRNYGSNINNLALACYWCNNAKTNYFTYDEFKIIGEKMKVVQQARINAIKPKP
jgi:5-methylcytosine-specific restriction endonuclease McrA